MQKIVAFLAASNRRALPEGGYFLFIAGDRLFSPSFLYLVPLLLLFLILLVLGSGFAARLVFLCLLFFYNSYIYLARFVVQFAHRNLLAFLVLFIVVIIVIVFVSFVLFML